MSIRKLQGTAGEIVILKQLGRGGMGEVFDANRLGNDGMVTTCVLKTLSLLLSDRDRERFYNEARIAAQLDHGNIVKVIEAGEIPGPLGGRGTPYLLMLRVDGVDLRKLQREFGQRFNLRVSTFIAGEALRALVYAHERYVRRRRATVIHYDIKPSNILISSSGEVKLTDFGIARFASSVEGTLSQAVGTLRYMSPEQFAGKGDEKSDIFSLGVVIWELLEGARLWGEYDDVAYQNLIMSGQVPELTQGDVPPRLAKLVRSMLALDPKERPSAADALSIILENTPHYQLGSKQLAEMYAEFIGEMSSGLTEMLELDGIGLEYKRLPVPAHVVDSTGLTPAAAPDEPTVGDRSEEDSPSIFRRRATPSVPARVERTYTEGPPLLVDERAHHQTPALVSEPPHEPGVQSLIVDDEPVVDPTIRLPPIFNEEPNAAAPVTGQRWPTPLPAASTSEPARSTLQLPAGGPIATGPSSDEAAPSGGTADSVALVEAQPKPPRTMAWIIGIAGSSIIILLTVLIGLVAKPSQAPERPEVEPPTTLADGELDSKPQSAAEPEPSDNSNPATPEEVTAEPGDTRLVEVEQVPVEPVPGDGGESGTDPTEEPKTEPVPEVEPPEPKPKPKPKPKPQMLVIFKVAGSPQKAEVKVGSRMLKNYNYAGSMRLTPGTYAIRWRLPGQESWHQPGSLTVKDIGSKSYEVVLSEAKVSPTIKGAGK